MEDMAAILTQLLFFIKLDLTMSPAAHTVFQLPETPQHRQVYKLLSIVFFNGHLLKILLGKKLILAKNIRTC
jgi:hypothetical protein